ncbi:O-antigen ligase family protein [Sulfobacillus thermosulfidooxidans]|uniref:O-antigen ligase family protein n=1 Tax=Sulfobacillus thermosulfidooxidans TaxID=28034 RepID=UPI000414DF2B|nr:O-antigen ligase family protein [Sulfobacillus thermosulfidooxidans]
MIRDAHNGSSINRISNLGIFLAIMLLLFFLITPFYKGLFFSPSQDVVSVIVLVTGLVLITGWIFRKKTENLSINIVDGAIGLYILLYGLGIFHAADPSLAYQGAWTAFMVGLFYVAGRVLRTESYAYLSKVLVIIGLSAVIIGIVGVANAWHQLYYPAAFSMTEHAVSLSSVFQYHNTFAAWEGSYALAGLTLLTLNKKTLSNVVQSWIWASSAFSMAMMIRSHSRGELLVWLLVLVWLLWRWQSVRLAFVRNLFVVTLGLIPGYVSLRTGMDHQNPAFGWLGVGTIFIGPIFFNYLVTHFLSGRKALNRFGAVLSRRVWPLITVVSVLLIITVIADTHIRHSLGKYFQLKTISSTSLPQRLMLWHDGLKLTLLRPLLGWGAGGWHDTYQMVRSQPYNISQVHSFLIQTTIDIGLLGAVLLLIMAWALIRATHLPIDLDTDERSASYTLSVPFAVFALGLMIHALGDWDMSFLYVRASWFLALGVAVSAERWKTTHFSRLPSMIVAMAAVILMGVGILGASTAYYSQQLITKALAVRSGPKQIELMKRAHALAPYSANIFMLWGHAENSLGDSPRIQNTALELYLHGAKLNQYSPQIQEQAATTAAQLGNWRMAFKLAMQGFSDSPLSAYEVDQVANTAAPFALQLYKNDPSHAEREAEKVLQIISQWQNHPDRSGELSGFTQDSIATLDLIDSHPKDAIVYLKQPLLSSDPETRDLASLLYYVSQYKEGTISLAAITAFVSSHPDVEPAYTLLKVLLN